MKDYVVERAKMSTLGEVWAGGCSGPNIDRISFLFVS